MNAPDAASVDEAKRVHAELRRIGPIFDEDVLKRTYALYVPLQERAPRAGVIAQRNLAYGPDERHLLDVFTPEHPSSGLVPVVMFLHGGGYIAGERSPVPGIIYDNVPTFFARHGMVGVNATYRLAPTHRWPSGGEDVGRAVVWLQENARRFGGDPERIFVVGHSAGATHAATWTFMREIHGADGPGVAGVALISGVYAATHPGYTSDPPRPNQFAYYGEDVARWPTMWPFDHVRPGHPPVFIAMSALEPYHFTWPSIALLDALLKCDRKMPAFRLLPDHNHVSSALQINCEIDDLGGDLLSFVRGVG